MAAVGLHTFQISRLNPVFSKDRDHHIFSGGDLQEEIICVLPHCVVQRLLTPDGKKCVVIGKILCMEHM